MATIKIEGVVVYDTKAQKYIFVDWLEPSHFQSGAYQSDYFSYVLVCPYTVKVAEPEDLDVVTPQLRDLDRQESDLTATYQAAKTQIEAKRQNLLAIECAVQS